jgi:hypothetical protein
MKTIWLAAAAVTLAVAANAASALADGPRPSSTHTIFQTAATQPLDGPAAAQRYQWQYHYVGHHPRFEGYWAVVR